MHTSIVFRCSPLLLCIPLYACQPSIPDVRHWTGRAIIAESRSIPIHLELDIRSPNPTAAFIVSDERTPVPEVILRGDSLLLVVSEYGAALRLRWDGQQFVGKYERYRVDTTGMDVQLRPQPPSGLARTTPSAIRLAGSFSVHRWTASGMDSAAVAVFWAREDSVFGTIIAPSGDDGLFAGVQSGDTVTLARFTGWQSIYMEIIRDGFEWRGRRFIRETPPDSFRLSPRSGSEPVTPPERATRPRAGTRGFSFHGVTLDGDSLTERSARFAGKPLIIDIMGTWCHNCLDAASVLQNIYEEFSPKGLEVVALSFELTDDPAVGRKNLTIFKERHGITYPLLFAGDLSPENVQARIGSQLENFGAYPTAIFIDRTGTITDIHKGFRGPGTGDAYQSEIEYFLEKARKLTEHAKKGG